MAADAQIPGNDVGYAMYQKGDAVFLAGTPPEARIFYLAKGFVDLSLGGSADANIIRTVSEGQFFGEMGALTGNPRTISATVASTEARILVLSPGKFLSIVAKNSQLRLELCRNATQRYLRALSALIEINSGSPQKKAGSQGRIDIQRRFNIDEFTSVLPLQSYFGGDIIYDDANSRTKKICWIINGEVQLKIRNDKHELLSTTLTKGDFFGAISFLSEEYSVRTRVIVSSSRLSVRYLDEKNVLDLSEKNPLFLYSLLKILLIGAENLEWQLIR